MRREAIIYYLAKDRVPIKAWHYRGLKKMINTLNKCYIIPLCNCFTKLNDMCCIPSVKEERQSDEEIEEDLKRAKKSLI